MEFLVERVRMTSWRRRRRKWAAGEEMKNNEKRREKWGNKEKKWRIVKINEMIFIY